MKTYFHYLVDLLKKTWQEDKLDVIMPICTSLSCILIIAGPILSVAFLNVWFMLLTYLGILLLPPVLIRVVNWVIEEGEAYEKWKNKSTRRDEKP